MRLRLLVAALLVLSLPASADAATLVKDGSTLVYTAASGANVNRISLEHRKIGTVRVHRENGDQDPIEPVVAPGCTIIEDTISLQEIECDGIYLIRAYVGAGNDDVGSPGVNGTIEEIYGGDGHDELSGGEANDVIDGGPGDDTISGGGGRPSSFFAESLMGGVGDDELTGSRYTATINGGDGDDMLRAEGGDAALIGGNGDDVLQRLIGGSIDAANVLSGGPGVDRAEYFSLRRAAFTATLDDVADDGYGHENIRSEVEDVRVYTDPGATAVLAGSDVGNELTVIGGANATLTGGAGGDDLTSGGGDDTIDARDGYQDRVVCNAGADSVSADQLDQVSDTCESVTREPVVLTAPEDRPPTVAWTAPAAGARVPAGGVATTLAVSASDDHGIAKVQFYDDDRLLCEDTALPYACAYTPRTADVGRNTLIALAVDTAGQTAGAIQTVTVDRFGARALTLRVTPRRDTRAPYRFTASGRLKLSAPVARSDAGGEVTIKVTAAGKTVATRRIALTRTGTYRGRITFIRRPGTRLRFSARYGGNAVMNPQPAPAVTVRTVAGTD